MYFHSCHVIHVIFFHVARDLYTTHAKSINSIVAKCENVLIQSPWIGITWIYQSIQSVTKYLHMNRLDQVKRMTQMIQFNQSINSIYMLTFFGRPISLTFLENVRFRWPFWDTLNQFNGFNRTTPSKSIGSVTYFMKTNWLSHRSTHLEKELNQFNQFCGKWIDPNQSTQSSWLVWKSI